MKKIFITLILGILIGQGLIAQGSEFTRGDDDLDPLVDLEITISINAIRALDSFDSISDPDFYVKIIVNNKEYESPVMSDQQYCYQVWETSIDVPDDEEFVDIILQLWESNPVFDTLCDINDAVNTASSGKDIALRYSLKTGIWYGDDYQGDPSGFGRGNGCGDGTIYDDDHDAEMWFSISQNDFDADTLPYWIETEVYGTDPLVDNSGEDTDNDGCSIEWEHHFGYNPLIWDDHEHYDTDDDSLTNLEEYLTRDFGTDPDRQDVLLELDFMEDSPDGTVSIIPESAEEYLKNPFHRRNIVFHIDSGVVDGGDILAFDDVVEFDEVRELYYSNFLHDDPEHWKRGVFHYGLIVYECSPGGYGFSGDVSPYMGYIPGTNGFIISSQHIEKNDRWIPSKELDYCYGSAIMHEMGHNFGMRWGNPFGCDAQRGKRPWQLGFWRYGNYKSIMNYRYTYKIFDYSDGSHGFRDHNDWEAVDLSYFEIPAS